MKTLFSKLWTWITGRSADLWDFLQPILAREAGALLQQILPIALTVVREVAQTRDLPNAKRDAAYAKLKAAVEAAGMAASTSVLNSAVELAYQRLKAETPSRD